jgi:hypothetical protein
MLLIELPAATITLMNKTTPFRLEAKCGHPTLLSRLSKIEIRQRTICLKLFLIDTQYI